MSTLKRKAGTLSSADSKKPKQDGSIMSFFGAPKPVAKGSAAAGSGNGAVAAAAAADTPAPKFDKEKWVAGLTAEQRELLQLEIDTLHESWLAHLKDEVTSKEFLDLKRFLNRETSAGRKWFPPKEDVYSWSVSQSLIPQLTQFVCVNTAPGPAIPPFNNVKVVIVGQDPYHNHNQAHGLAFSVRPPTPAPPSLKNMYIALQKDYPSFSPPPKKGGLLTPWADRGVLMLNTCLTVRAHEANSHSNRGWERFTQKVLDLVAQKRSRGVVYMAWGTPAGKRVVKIDAKKHLILKSVHPSPLSASRGFFDCGHFRKANDWLVERYGAGAEIDWDLSGAKKAEAPAPAPVEKKEEDDDDEIDEDAMAAMAAAAEEEAETKASLKKE